jgi:methylated-DNA-[protein]-cysteine S-methyltransferase
MPVELPLAAVVRTSWESPGSVTHAASRSFSHASTVVETPMGAIGIEATDRGVSRVRLPGGAARTAVTSGVGPAADTVSAAEGQLQEYLRGERDAFDLPLDWDGVDEPHRGVLETLCEAAPFGTTITYGELARRAGVEDPRDVGVMMSRNPLPLVVPCHRVVAADGLGGYGGGPELKRRLLELEGSLPARLDLDGA